ncbi:MAG TPA: hypothetical protein VFC82_05570, partial [Actinomycetaceae bacterium]|nr:hypothetical protein [Actinomycetaceae bacterium]
MPARPTRLLRSTRTAALAPIAVVVLAGCTSAISGPATTPSSAEGLFDDAVVHSIDVQVDGAAYDAMIETYTSTGEKEWLSATVTIDGVEYEAVGIKLKGNSSLRGLG